jgi:Methyltransferase domain
MGIAAKIVWHARSGDLIDAVSRRIDPRRRLTNPTLGHSARRINKLFDDLPGAARYLEIGLEFGYTFKNIKAPVRWGVDPNPRFDVTRLPPGTHVAVTTSDKFFEDIDPRTSFDVVFIDGLHTFRQAYRDLINALRVCPRGVILIDDVVPSDEVSAIPNREKSFRERSLRGLEGYPWHGDVFRVLLCVKAHHPELSIRTIVGMDNPQALVWRNDPGVVSSASDIELDIIDTVSFTDVFGQGIPDSFIPRAESEAIEDWKSSLP